MNTENFKNWISINNIDKRAKEGFVFYMENYKREEPDEFNEIFSNVNLDNIESSISKISLTINYTFDEPVEFVSVILDIKYDNVELGVYEFLVALDGGDLDDYLRLK